MPQRQRPRLKAYTIICSQCGVSAVKLFPSRRAVRDKMSGFRFCSADCQRIHWEARRRAAWTATPYPCQQCGREIVPLQKPGRPSAYCSSKCRTAAGLERQRRDPAAAVLEAHKAVVSSWSRALRSCHEVVRLHEAVAKVTLAYESARLVTEDEASSERDKSEARQQIINKLFLLEGPKMDAAEPDRKKSDWRLWWVWWEKFLGNSEAVHGQNLEGLRIAGVELRRAKRVVARRAETARLRRSRRETTSASNERLVDSHPEADAASGPAAQ